MGGAWQSADQANAAVGRRSSVHAGSAEASILLSMLLNQLPYLLLVMPMTSVTSTVLTACMHAMTSVVMTVLMVRMHAISPVLILLQLMTSCVFVCCNAVFWQLVAPLVQVNSGECLMVYLSV